MGKNRNWFAIISILLLLGIANCAYADGLLHAVQDLSNPFVFWIDPSDDSYGPVGVLPATGDISGLAHIPEPATLGMLLIGGLVLLPRRAVLILRERGKEYEKGAIGFNDGVD